MLLRGASLLKAGRRATLPPRCLSIEQTVQVSLRKFSTSGEASKCAPAATPAAASSASSAPVNASKPKYKEAKIGNVRPDGRSTRWYKEASVEPYEIAGETGWLVLLDGRVIRTPKDSRLLLPSKQLALAVAAEWEMQHQNVMPSDMPLMTLAATALDQVPTRRGIIVDSLMSYLKTDSLCIREDEGDVADKQAKMHDPLLKWFSQRFKLPPVTPSGGIDSAAIPHEAMHRLQWMLFQQDDWVLAGLDSLASNTKSLILSLALWQGAVPLEQGVRAARVEEDHGIETYGEIAGHHDIDRTNATVNIAAATVFLHILPRVDPAKLNI